MLTEEVALLRNDGRQISQAQCNKNLLIWNWMHY